jgi:hypothetical protein
LTRTEHRVFERLTQDQPDIPATATKRAVSTFKKIVKTAFFQTGISPPAISAVK